MVAMFTAYDGSTTRVSFLFSTKVILSVREKERKKRVFVLSLFRIARARCYARFKNFCTERTTLLKDLKFC